MAAPTNTLTTLTPVVGVREDIENDVYRVAPEDCPFQTSIGKEKAKATYHEWQTQALRTPNGANAAVEGGNATATAAKVRVRVGNYTQIFTESGSVSGTQQAVDHAGVEDELDEQKLLKGIEVKTDVEAALLGNHASAAETSGPTPRYMAGVLAWATSNVSRGAGGASGGFSAGVVAAATNGTQRLPTEAGYKALLSGAFSKGVKYKTAIMGAVQKQEFSAFTGIGDIRVNAEGGKMASIVGAAEIYTSDFGTQSLVPHMFGLTRDILVYDPEMLAVATLRPMFTVPLAKTGDADQFEIITEKTLVVKNEKAIGVYADLL